jgi:hypothetical protein
MTRRVSLERFLGQLRLFLDNTSFSMVSYFIIWNMYVDGLAAKPLFDFFSPYLLLVVSLLAGGALEVWVVAALSCVLPTLAV